MIRSNLALVLPYPLPFSLSSTLPSSCIFNELFTIVRYKLGQLHKCWRFHIPSHLLPFGAVVDHPSLQKKCSQIHKRNSMSTSTCKIVQRPYYVLFCTTFRTGLRTKSTVLVCRNYDSTTITIWERLPTVVPYRMLFIGYRNLADIKNLSACNSSDTPSFTGDVVIPDSTCTWRV